MVISQETNLVVKNYALNTYFVFVDLSNKEYPIVSRSPELMEYRFRFVFYGELDVLRHFKSNSHYKRVIWQLIQIMDLEGRHSVVSDFMSPA